MADGRNVLLWYLIGLIFYQWYIFMYIQSNFDGVSHKGGKWLLTFKGGRCHMLE